MSSTSSDFRSNVSNMSAHNTQQVFRHRDPIPDANKRYLMILEENARAQMELFSPKHSSSAQRIGRLYGAGMNHQLVDSGVDREMAMRKNGAKDSVTEGALGSTGVLPPQRGESKDRGGLQNNTISLQHSATTKHQYPSNVQSRHTFNAYPSHASYGGGKAAEAPPMKSSQALGLLDSQPGGRYHVPDHLQEPYAEQLMGQPQGSFFTKSTPLMWNLRKPEEADCSACSKSGFVKWGTDQSRLPTAHIPNDVGSPHYNQRVLQQSSLRNTPTAFLSGHDVIQEDLVGQFSSLQSVGHGKQQSMTTGGEGEMSALQQTLVDCGKLTRADGLQAGQRAQQVHKSLQADIQHTKKHAMWLKQKKKSKCREEDISGVEDQAGSFFSQEEAQCQDALHESLDESTCPSSVRGTVRGKVSITGTDTEAKSIRQRERDAVKTLRQRNSLSTSSGGLAKYKKRGNSRSSSGFRGNSSVINMKGSALEDSRILDSKPTYTESSSMLNSTRRRKDHDKSLRGNAYSEDLAAHLEVTLVANSNNPHRGQFRGDSDVKFSAHQSLNALQKKNVDPRVYSKSTMNSQYGTYNVTVKEPIVRDLPSKEYINSAMTHISKRLLITYSTRIVETGAALRAMQDTRHENPGIAAILDLNRAMIAAAAFNPSPWEVSRVQFEHVMGEQVPWLDQAVVARLASAYDPQRKGVIKFARMTAALMSGNRPAMSILMTKISRDPDKVDESGNVFLLRLLHSLYEDCDGGVVEEIASTLETDPSKCMQMANPYSKTGLGIKLEDVPEILSVCASTVEDEALVQGLAMEVVQVLYECGKRNGEEFTSVEERYRSMRNPSQSLPLQSEEGSMQASLLSSFSGSGEGSSLHKDRLYATNVLKFDLLKSITTIERVSQNAFIKCVARHPSIMKEFGRQVERFRELITPYQMKGSLTYEDSISQRSSYGTICH